jgi:uncharacterized protein
MSNHDGDHLVSEAADLFNRGEYYECHEVLEAPWREAEGIEKIFLQSLILAAVALHHDRCGNVRGAVGVYHKARERMLALPSTFRKIELRMLLDALDRYFDSLPAERQPPLILFVEE